MALVPSFSAYRAYFSSSSSMRQHLYEQLRPRLQWRQATRTRLFSSAPARWSIDDSRPGNQELGAPSQPWGRPHNTRHWRLPFKMADLLAKDPEAYERVCVERNYPAVAKYPREIHRLRQLQRESASCQPSHTERLKAVQDLLKGFDSKQEPPTSWSSRPSRKGLVGMTREQLLQEARTLKEEVKGRREYERVIRKEMFRLSKSLPNITSPETPRGKSPKVIGYINDHPMNSPSYSARSHTLIGEELEVLDFAMAGVTTGWGWYYLLNEAAQLEQALIQYALSVARKRGWGVVAPPSMVNSEISSACGFQPRDQNGEQQVYSIQKSHKDENKPERCLAGTSEIPLAAMLADRAISVQNLPKKHVAVSRCYRAEAGARGLSSKGLYRVHEFTKVEMFAWTYPTDEASTAVFDEIHKIQVEILTSLGLHCRILEMPSRDLGASATRKRDIEAFFPSRSMDDGFGEVTSVSTCTDYQTAGLHTNVEGLEHANITFETLHANSDGTSSQSNPQSKHPFTVNGTALAVPRVLAAILENCWNEEKREVAIPECLWPWMDGVKVISSKQMTSSNSVPAADLEKHPVISMSDDISSESQDRLMETIEDDESLSEESTTFEEFEESDLDNGSEEDLTTRIEGDEVIIESQDPDSVVEEDEVSGEAQGDQAIIDTPTEEISSSVEPAGSDEIVANEEASELSSSAEVVEDISSIVTQANEATQSAEETQRDEPDQGENAPPNKTQPTEETQPFEEAKDESTNSIFSRFLGR